MGDQSIGSEAAYQAALSRLPDAYALALRCTDSAMPDDEICDKLGIEPEALAALLDMARRKLRTELTRREQDHL